MAHELRLPVVVVPSLASTDAPCTALSVVYSDAGVVEEVVYFPTSPAMVVVDTAVIAEAPPAYLVAGMGDAMATWWVSEAAALRDAQQAAAAAAAERHVCILVLTACEGVECINSVNGPACPLNWQWVAASLALKLATAFDNSCWCHAAAGPAGMRRAQWHATPQPPPRLHP